MLKGGGASTGSILCWQRLLPHAPHSTRVRIHSAPLDRLCLFIGNRALVLDALSPLGTLGNGVAGGEGAIYFWAKLPEHSKDDVKVGQKELGWTEFLLASGGALKQRGGRERPVAPGQPPWITAFPPNALPAPPMSPPQPRQSSGWCGTRACA